MQSGYKIHLFFFAQGINLFCHLQMSERTVIDIISANNEVFRIAQTISNSSKSIMWLLSKVLNVKKNSIKTAAVVLTGDLGNLLGKELDLRVIWDYPPIASLTQYLSE